jgi:proteic killer suppression protein
MIVSFADEATANLYHGRRTKRVRRLPHDILQRALVRLDVLNTAHSLMDLSSPPGNHLEALGGDLDRLSQYSY